MNEFNFYKRVANHFNMSPEERELARQEELNSIIESIDTIEYNDYAAEDWDFIY